MSFTRTESGPPASGPTKNELAVLRELQQMGEGMALSTTQLASMTGLHTSSVAIACQRLVERRRIRRHAPSNVLDPVRWSLAEEERGDA
jgi:DNA-binding IclR family transcriptional regulator